MNVGLIGLSLAGKTTVFRAVTGVEAPLSRSLGERREPREAAVPVPDARLDALQKVYASRKRTAATVELVDQPGIRPGASDREASFAPAVRSVEALALVVRGFEGAGVPHPLDGVDPVRDLALMRDELLLTDLEVVERRIERVEKDLSRGKLEYEAEHRMWQRCRDGLNEGRPVRSLAWSAAEETMMRGFGLLSAKKVMVVANVGEEGLSPALRQGLEKGAAEQGAPFGVLAAALEMELAGLDPAEQETWRESYGLHESAKEAFIHEAYRCIDAITYYTVGENEARAWTIWRGATALDAAGKVHTDLARGFVRAEVIHYDEFMAHGSVAAARDKGLYRLEGREYPVKDGDIILIRHNK